MYFVSALEGSRVLGGSLSGPIHTTGPGLGGAAIVRNHSFNSNSNSNHGSGSGSSSDIESRHRVDCDADSLGGDDSSSVVSPSIWQRLALFSSPVKKKDKHYQQQGSLTSLSESNDITSHPPDDHHKVDHHRGENLSGSSNHNKVIPDHSHDTPSAALDDSTRPLLHPTPNKQKGMLL